MFMKPSTIFIKNLIPEIKQMKPQAQGGHSK